MKEWHEWAKTRKAELREALNHFDKIENQRGTGEYSKKPGLRHGPLQRTKHRVGEERGGEKEERLLKKRMGELLFPWPSKGIKQGKAADRKFRWGISPMLMRRRENKIRKKKKRFRRCIKGFRGLRRAFRIKTRLCTTAAKNAKKGRKSFSIWHCWNKKLARGRFKNSSTLT